MKWNRKYIIICSALFAVLVIFLVGKGFQRGNSNDNLTQSLEKAVSTDYPATGNSVTGSSVIEKSVTESLVTGSSVSEKKTEKKSKNQVKNKKETAQNTKKNIKKSGTETQKESDAKQQKKDKANVKKESGNKTQEEKVPMATALPLPTEAPKAVSFQIDCLRILNKKDLWKKGIEEIIPENGIFYQGTLSFTEGQSVYDLLRKICSENKIALDSQYTPLYGTYYIKGIGNLYEFDCGEESGWKYSVNGKLPGVGCSSYPIKAGDKIQFFYDYEY
ncbi:MAG: DUF4430 domain-containing protein [Eubacterium sp.]|nr:DUF4430 domain-containing protein [Eubacterium sp.]